MSPADGRLLPRTAAGPTERAREPLQERSMRTSVLYRSACAHRTQPIRRPGDIRRGRSELPAVDLAAVPGVEHKDHEPALVDGVEHPVVADPDAQHAVGTCDHLQRGRARIRSKGIDGLADPAAYRLIQGQERLPGARPPLDPVRHRCYSPASALTCSHGTDSPGSASASRAAAASARSSSNSRASRSLMPPSASANSAGTIAASRSPCSVRYTTCPRAASRAAPATPGVPSTGSSLMTSG